MEPRGAGMVSFRRLFDDGAPFALPLGGGGAGAVEALAIATEMCVNPDCPCREMRLVVRDLETTSRGRMRVLESSEAHVEFNVDTAELAACDGPSGRARSQALVDVLRQSLGEDHREFLRERWRRARSQRRDEWRKQDWARIDTQHLVPYSEVFPSDWDLGVDCFGQRFWLLDSWCLKPHCPCSDFHVEVLGADGAVGVIRVETRTWKAADPEPGSLACEVWNDFIRKPGRRSILRRRRDAMRGVARELQRATPEGPPPLPPPKSAECTGRNDPCPCGSGKKYKKCCAAPGKALRGG